MPTGKSENQSDSPKKSRNTDTYRCRHRAFLRICLAEGMEPKEVFAKAKVPDRQRRRITNREPVELRWFLAIAKVIRCEPTSLFYSFEQPVSHNDPARVFAQTVERLIDQGRIPDIDELTGTPTNVVEYVWQLEDTELENMRLSFREQREGFMILRDECLRLIERPLHAGTRRRQIGTMHIGITDLNDIVDDVEICRTLTTEAIRRLEQQYRKGYLPHITRISEQLYDRVLNYRDTVAIDEQQIDADGKYQVDIRLIDNVIGADFHVRKIYFPTHQQDEIFEQYYSRSKWLIHHILRNRVEDFADWWPRFRRDNDGDIDAIHEAWEGERPDWDALIKISDDNMDRTVDEIKDVYAGLTRQSSSGNGK